MAPQDLQGPFRTVTLGNTVMPWYMTSYDRRGRCTSPRTAQEVVDRAASGSYTDVVLFSHGWNNDWAQSTSHYESFVGGYLDQVRDHPPAGGVRSVLLVGIFWPSKALVDERGRAPAIAGGRGREGSGDPAVAQFRDDVDELGQSLPPEQADRLYELAQRDGLEPAEARELAAMFLALFDRDVTELGEPDRPDPADIVRGWLAGAAGRGEVPDLDPLGYHEDVLLAGPGHDGADPRQVGEDGGPQAAGGTLLDPLGIVRSLTVWQMKDRAGVIGAAGVAPLLSDLLRTGVRVHCIGHSYGAKVVLSAIAAMPASGRTVRSALLLQPAVSYLCFAAAVPGTDRAGGYRAVLDRVDLPILSTFSADDVPLTRFYQHALRRRGDVGEPAAAAGGHAPNRYAALGGFGPGGLRADEYEELAVKPPGRWYPPARAGVRVRGVRATGVITGHGNVSNPATWWLLRHLLHADG